MKRILKNTAATLQATFYSDEATVDADGAVTVTITKADGTVLVNAAAASHVGAAGSGLYQYVLAPQATLEQLTASWSGTFSTIPQTVTSGVEIVGGTLFSLAEARASDASLADTTKYPTSALAAARTEVEEEFEHICGVNFFPRYRRITLDGSGTAAIWIADPLPLAIRSVKTLATDGTPTSFTAAELAAIRLSRTGRIERVTGEFASGSSNIIVEYESGFSFVPDSVRRAGLLRLRSRLNLHKSAIPDRATSFSIGEGGTYRLDTAGPLATGLPEVDAVLSRPGINFRSPSVA